MSDPDLDDVLNAHAADIARLDEAVVLDVVGVAQAAHEMRVALDALDALLDERRLEKAAALGYRDIASAFVFLQRTLGALQTLDHDLSALISKIAGAMHCAYEDVEPHVLARMTNMRARRAENAGMTATVRAKGRVDLPEAVRDHLGVETGGSLRFEPMTDGRVAMVLEDAGERSDILAELRDRVERGLDADEKTRDEGSP
jgi:bifunctional DNA-binding transcriptional regulator/antitoxin component of YhaV-PrlF toxin-antitoxin module